jgi:hypothetical protein
VARPLTPAAARSGVEQNTPQVSAQRAPVLLSALLPAALYQRHIQPRPSAVSRPRARSWLGGRELRSTPLATRLFNSPRILNSYLRPKSSSGGCRGVQPPGDTGHSGRPGAGGAGGAGLPRGQGRWDGRARRLLDQAPPKAAPPSRRVRPHALIALDQGHGRDAGLRLALSVTNDTTCRCFATQAARIRAATRPFAPHNNPRVVNELRR